MPIRQILLIEDHERTLSNLAKSFTQHVETYRGETETYEVTTARTRDEGYALGKYMRDTLDGAVVDSQLPVDTVALRQRKLDIHAGIWIIRQWRNDGILFPTILVTQHMRIGDEIARRVVRENAATFFVEKRYQAEPGIVLPMQNLIRIVDPPQDKLVVGPYLLKIAVRRLLVNGKVVNLTPTETRLLELFMLNDGKLLTIRKLCVKIRQPSKDTPSKETLLKHISNLKIKFEKATFSPLPIRNLQAEPHASDDSSGYYGQFSAMVIPS